MKNTIEALAAEMTAYDTKPTKASSKRLRLLLGDIKRNAAAWRAELVEADKKS